jgi:hypothetical protein
MLDHVCVLGPPGTIITIRLAIGGNALAAPESKIHIIKRRRFLGRLTCRSRYKGAAMRRISYIMSKMSAIESEVLEQNSLTAVVRIFASRLFKGTH